MSTTEIVLSDQQQIALDAVAEWLGAYTESQQVFRLFGYAGTGKTTIARHVLRMAGNVALCAFTGKAASVLSRKTGRSATTVHRLIYQRVDHKRREDIASLVALVESLGIEFVAEKAVVRTIGGEVPPMVARKLSERRDELHAFLLERDGRARMTDEERAEADLVRKKADRSGERLVWTLRGEHDLDEVDLVILDECSMIGRDLWLDLLSFGRPILAIGDPAQLPPVHDTSPITGVSPDAMLSEIHRQKAGNGIAEFAQEIRLGNPEWRNRGGGGVSIKRWPSPAWYLDFDQTICGSNRTRNKINASVREMLGHDRGGNVPQRGEKLICLRNRPEDGIMNGQQFEVVQAKIDPQRLAVVDLILKDHGVESPRVFRCVASMQALSTGEADTVTSRTLAQFAFGYAITAHKSQGSEWPSVLVIDEGGCFGREAGKWLYTAVTRASEEVVICTGGPMSTHLDGEPIA